MTQLAAPRVLVWCCPQSALDDPEALRQAWSVVSKAERTKLVGLVRLPDGAARQRQALLARALCRRALSATNPSIQAADWSLAHRASGAPFARAGAHLENSPIGFSLSHTDGMVVCATCVGGQVGVDIECTTRHVRAAQIAARLFAPEECAYVMAHRDGPPRTQAFLMLWTLKEAYLKLLGLGLAHLTPSMAFAAHSNGEVQGTMAQTGTEHLFMQSRLVSQSHRLALVVQTASEQAPVWQWMYGWAAQPAATSANAYVVAGTAASASSISGAKSF